MFLFSIVLSIFLMGSMLTANPGASVDLPRTVPEKTNHESTSTYKDVHGFFSKIKELYPQYIYMSEMGKTFEVGKQHRQKHYDVKLAQMW